MPGEARAGKKNSRLSRESYKETQGRVGREDKCSVQCQDIHKLPSACAVRPRAETTDIRDRRIVSIVSA